MNALSTVRGIVIMENPNQGLDDLRTAGFSDLYLDLDIVCPAHIMEDYGTSVFRSSFASRAAEDPMRLIECASPLFDKAKERGLAISLVKAPTLLPFTRRMDLNGRIRDLAMESIKLCGKYGVRYCIIPPIVAGIEKEYLLRDNISFYRSLIPSLKEHHITLLLENQCRFLCGHYIRGICSDRMQALQWLEDLNREAQKECFGFAFNVGNANLCGMNMYEFLTTLGDTVKAVIISDNNGVDPAYLLPFTSDNGNGPNTDWLNLIRGVRAIDFDGEVALEFAHTFGDASPFLKPTLLAYAGKMGDYFLWQFEMERMVKNAGRRVLFGAGNMCRNYMKNYGTEYPPLYTCDNNSANWGKNFEGLMIKPPEELKNLPSDVTVMICNVYYREITTQLRSMGIENPIVYFNDEYMPSFYFDRLDIAVGSTT